MKILNKIFALISIIIFATLINSCSDDEIQEDAPLAKAEIKNMVGEELVFIEDTYRYTVNSYRGGSEYIWSVDGADFSPVEGKPNQIDVTFTQIENLVTISVFEKALNGTISETIIKDVKVFGTPCDWRLDMQDTYGDGWNGAYITITFDGYEAGEFFIENFSSPTNPEGYSASKIISTPNGSNVELTFHSGDWDSEITYQLYNASDIVLAEGPTPTAGVVYSEINECP